MSAQRQPESGSATLDRRWLAGLLIGGWVGLTAGAFWYFEFQFLKPIVRPASAKALQMGEAAPIRELETLSGERIALGEGGPTVLHFWNPECPCSRFNEPSVKRMAEVNPEVRFVLVIEEAELTAKLREKVETTFPFPAVHDADGAIAKAFGAFATPAACLLDAEGRVQFMGTYLATAYCSSQQTDAVQVALAAMLSGKDAPASAPAYGCAIPMP